MSEKVLVTGANGFTGSKLCRHLLARGNKVVAMVRSPAKGVNGLPADPNLEVAHGDLSRGDGVPADAFEGVSVVYHIAALYRQEGADREAFHKVNVSGTGQVLRAARHAGVRRFVHCSTGGVHGNIENPPANENAPLRPGDLYQETKLEGEKLALAFGKENGLGVSVIRPTAIYGAGDLRFLKLYKSINNGTFRMIGDGRPLYHFVYVDDLVQGFLLAGEKEAAIGEVFIIAGPEYVSISTLVEMIARELGRTVPKWHIPVWPVMTAARLCKAVCHPLGIEPPLYPRRLDFFLKDRAFDSSKAGKLLGYAPRVGLKEGIADTAAWYRENNLL